MVNFVTANGGIKAFGILAALTALGFLAIPLLQVFGARFSTRFRKISGPILHAIPAVSKTMSPAYGVVDGTEATERRPVEVIGAHFNLESEVTVLSYQAAICRAWTVVGRPCLKYGNDTPRTCILP